jgi:hypothetical protein
MVTPRLTTQPSPAPSNSNSSGGSSASESPASGRGGMFGTIAISWEPIERRHLDALAQFEACAAAAGDDEADPCWSSLQANLRDALPSLNDRSSASAAPIADALDMAIERFMECMDSSDMTNDRQTCVDALLQDLNGAVPATQLTSDQQLEFAEAMAELSDCLQTSSSVQQDFACLRAFYDQVMNVMHLPVLAVKLQKRVFGSPKALMRSCFTDATATLTACLKAIAIAPDAAQRSAAYRKCLDEYHALLKTCSCLANNGLDCASKPDS